MAWRGLAVLLVVLGSGVSAAGAAAPEGAATEGAIAREALVPWADLTGKAVLRVDQVADLKALVGVQSVLRERSGGQVRLLAVGRSEVWFVADSPPVGGWTALLGQEARLVAPDRREAPEDLHAVRLWTPVPLHAEPVDGLPSR